MCVSYTETTVICWFVWTTFLHPRDKATQPREMPRFVTTQIYRFCGSENFNLVIPQRCYLWFIHYKSSKHKETQYQPHNISNASPNRELLLASMLMRLNLISRQIWRKLNKFIWAVTTKRGSLNLNKRQMQTACGGWWWRLKTLKEFIGKSFYERNYLLPFSMSDFPQFITTFICCVKQMKQELTSWAHSSLLISIFEISLSRSVWFSC